MADENDDDEVKLPGLPPNTKNYMTPACYRRLLDEREHLVNVERPEVVNVVSWAASNGDRSENGDDQKGEEHKIRIVGIDEADANHGDVSWISPIARVFLKAREGDEVKLPTPATVTHPAGVETLEILEVTYTSRQPR